MCSSNVLLYINISSMNTKTNFLMNGAKMEFIRHWKVEGALVSPNGIALSENVHDVF
jgi:hypothetical protein